MYQLIVLGVKSRYANVFHAKVAWLQLTPNHNDITGKTMKTYRIFITSLLFSLIMASASAATYKWFDENGNVVYSQQPPEGRPYETVKTTKPSSTSPRPTPAESSFMTKQQEKAEEAKKNSTVQQEVAKGEAMRAENCKAAKQNLESYTAFRRVRNEQGEVIMLDDNERARLIEESKEDIKEFCD